MASFKKRIGSCVIAVTMIFGFSMPAFANTALDAMASAGEAQQSVKRQAKADFSAVQTDISAFLDDISARVQEIESTRAAVATVSTFAQLQAAAADDSTNIIILLNDIAMPQAVTFNRTVLFSASGVTLTAASSRHFIVTGGEVILSLTGVTLDGAGTGGGIESTAAHLVLQDVTIQNCTASSVGGAVNARNVSIAQGQFLNNTAAVGGAIFGWQIVLARCTIENNNAASSGGGVNASISLEAVDSSFHANSSRYGGGIAMGQGAAVSLRGVSMDGNTASAGGALLCDGDALLQECIITRSYASNGGGAIATERGSHLVIEDSEINYNYAVDYGGAINLYDYTTAIMRRTTLNSNGAYGGGAVSLAEYSYLDLYQIEMQNNEVADEVGLGGAIYSTGHITLSSGNIYKNYAENGGAVYLGSGGYFEMFDGSIHHNHAASRGGAIYGAAGSSIEVEEGAIRNNLAYEGGAVYSNGYFAVIGGFYIYSNKAYTLGGAVYGGKDSRVQIAGEIFENEAEYGGAVYAENTVNISGSYTFVYKNTATDQGGAIYGTETASIQMNGGSIERNTARHSGGGIYARGGFSMTNGHVSSNQASGGGGIFLASMTEIATISGGVISSNTASTGGGIYSAGQVMISGGTISNNTATANGGGIYARQVPMTGGEITGNRAVNGGGIYYTSSFSIISGSITGNTASAYGGGAYGGAGSIGVVFGTGLTGNTAALGANPDIHSEGIVSGV